jgi:hypothetical protein
MSMERVKFLAKSAAFLLCFGIILPTLFFDVSKSEAASIIYSNYSTGNDTTGDGTSGNPYKTFHKAYTIAVSGDTIDLTGTFDLTNADETGDAASSGYTIAKSLTIQGQSADATFIQAASSAYTANRRIFTVNPNINVTIQRVTLRYGYANSDNFSGTAISSTANLTVLNSMITENANPARFGGAAINYSGSGNFVIRNSTIYNNGNMTGYWRGYTAGIDGGGSGVNEITNCTFSNNRAEYNGGIYFSSGNLMITNSTFTGNYGGVTAADVGVWSSGTKAYIKNSIFADTAGGTNLYSGGSTSSFVDGGYNIIESIAGNTIITNGTNGNLVGNQANLNISASLALNDATNGVYTLALSSNSVAVNAGDPNDTANNGINVPLADERNFYRNGRTDIGAYEYDGSSTYSRPTTQASNITFSSVTYNSTTVGWTAGDGMRHAVFMKQANTGTASPVDSAAYTGNTAFGSGTQIGATGWYCVYNGSGTSVEVTGLTRSTDYIVQVFEYSGISGSELYLTDTATNNPKTQATTAVLQPTTQASNLTFSSVAYTTMTVSWTNGDGSKRAVFAKQANTGTASPVDDTTYTANAAFGSGTQIGTSGWYCIYNNTGTSVSVSGLTAQTDYIFQVFEYNGTAGIENYFTDSGSNNPLFQASATVTEPTTQAINLTFSSVVYTSMTVSWTSGNGAKRAVFAKQANTGTATPVDNTNYSASSTFGSGTQIGTSGWYCIYNSTGTSVSVSNLTAQTDYIFQVFEYNSSGSIYNYFLDSGTNNPRYQASATVTEPTSQATNLTFSSVNYTTMTVGWTIGNGGKRVVFAKQATSGTAEPVDNTAYTASTTFGSGTQIGTSGWYCIYNSTSTSVAITGLTANTEYIFQVFEYNDSGSTRNYYNSSGTNNPKSQITLAVATPTTQANTVTFSSVSSATMTVGWTNGNGSGRIVFVKQANTGTTTPVDNTVYTANSAFGSGTQIGTSGWYCVYSGTGTSVSISNLSGSTDYIAQVFEYNSSGSSFSYLTSSAVNNPKAQTTTTAPTEITLGTGSSATGASEASPINVWYRSSHGQSVYTAAEINAAGVSGPINITQVGFYISTSPNVPLPNFVIRMKHVTDANVSSWQTVTGMTTVYSSVSYAPVAGGFQSLTLSTPFTWNGTDNVVVDTAYSMNAGCSQTGTVRYYSSSNGYRAARSDSTDQTNTFSGGSTSSSKPQIKLNFAASQYTLSYTAAAHGSITGSASQTVNSGANGSAVTAVADTGHHFVNWSDNSTANPRTDTSVAANISVTANFAIDTHTATYTAGAHGSITGSTSQTVDYGSEGTSVTAVPDSHYHFISWSDNSTDNPRLDTNITENITVSANFAIDTYTVRYYSVEPGPSAGTAHGTISGTTTQSVDYGGSSTAVTAVPDAGYHFVSWNDDSTANPRIDTNVTGNLSIVANFVINSYSISYLAGTGGTLSGIQTQSVDYLNSGSAVTAIANSGYHFVSWSDDLTANPRTDTNIMTDMTITANFAVNNYILTYIAGEHGSLVGTLLQTINYGGAGTAILASAWPGYHFSSWSDGSMLNPRIDSGIIANLLVTATFTANEAVPFTPVETSTSSSSTPTIAEIVAVPTLVPADQDTSEDVENPLTENISQNMSITFQVIVDGKPLSNAKVFLHSTPREGMTDQNGYVTFNNVEPGDHKIKVVYGKKQYTQELSLKTGDEKKIDIVINADLKEPGPKLNHPLFYLFIYSLAISSVLLFLIRYKKIKGNYGKS